MKVTILDVTEYEADGWTWKTAEINNPTWEQIETAIRALNQDRKPFIWLWLNKNSFNEGAHLNVIGGNGIYAIDATLDGEHYQRYFDPEKGTQEIAVWTSDQGYSVQECYVCYDLNVVLKIGRHFAETGKLYSEFVQWTDKQGE